MDWNCNLRPHFVSQPADSHLNFFYNYNYDPYQEMKHSMQTTHTMLNSPIMDKNMNYGNQEKKKQRLTSDQLEALEKSFQEEIKLDPDRKTKLSKELGMEPRQIAVWFQNRRARWRTKELERLYETLKMEYDVVFTEKEKLQEEVVALRGIIKKQGGRMKPVSAGHNTEISGEETVESTSMPTSNNLRPANIANMNNQHMPGESYMYNNLDDYNGVLPPQPAYWAGLPTYQ